MRQLSLPGIQKSSEQIVSILLTTFLFGCRLLACTLFARPDSEQIVSILLTKFLIWMPVGCLRTVRALRRRVPMVRTPFAVVSVCMLAEGGEQVWQVWLLRFSFNCTRGAKGWI